MTEPLPITEDWLKSVGFKWDQFDRQTSKHWTLWMGRCGECAFDTRPLFISDEDFAIELAHNTLRAEGTDAGDNWWYCWFRSDTAGRYHRFIHVRHLRTQAEVIALIEALSGWPWNPANHFYGSLRCPRCADRVRENQTRIDRRRLEQATKWYPHEKDDTRAPANPCHIDAAIKGGFAK